MTPEDRQLRLLEGLRDAIRTKGGREFIWELLSECAIFRSLSSNDAIHMALRSGRRDVGLWVLNNLFSADPMAFQLMQKEAHERESERESEHDSDRYNSDN